MFSRMRLGTKIMLLATGCVVLPILIIFAFIQARGDVMRDSVNTELHKKSDAELTNITKGLYETIDQAVGASIRLNCLAIAKNAKIGVTLFHDQFVSGLISEEKAKKEAETFLLSQGIGESGYIYVLSRDGKILLHPKKELVGSDLTKHKFIRDQISSGSSVFFEYLWKNPGEETEREKCLAQEIFEPWGWIISASGYRDDLALLTKNEIEPSIRRLILEKKIGNTGYAYVLGAKGENKGRYVISFDGKRDGENLWEAKDSLGNLFIQSIVGKALSLQPGGIAAERYPWKNGSEKEARMKLAKITYYRPWDWVISAGAYEDEIEAPAVQIRKGFQSMMHSILLTCIFLVIVGSASGLMVTRGLLKPIKQVIDGLITGAELVSSASRQVSSSSQYLAESASEQAAALQETSSSLEEITSMVKQNSNHTDKADGLMAEASFEVKGANDSMVELNTSMEEIKIASGETQKIIKSIDEIAFQTNLLALNAAIEAARAGEAGAGFAIVAEEVRRLAMRAAEAARNTAGMIEGTMNRVKNGGDLVLRTSETVARVARSTETVGRLISEIATGSNNQAHGIEQMNVSVAEMDKGIQQTAQSAEENAGIAEEMDAQAIQLNAFVAKLVTVVEGRSDSPGRNLKRIL